MKMKLQLFANIAGAGSGGGLTPEEIAKINAKWQASVANNIKAGNWQHTENKVNNDTTGAFSGIKQQIDKPKYTLADLSGDPIQTEPKQNDWAKQNTGAGINQVGVPQPPPPQNTAIDGAIDINDTPGTPTSAIQSYNGMASEDYRNMLLNKLKAGVNSSADSSLAAVKQNLADAIAELENEKSKAQPEYESNVKTINQNEYTDTEQMKELLNSSGWNPSAAGLGVGEVGKIANTATNSRNSARAALTTLLDDIGRRTTLANTHASNSIAEIEKDRASKLAQAEADAYLQADDRGYSRWRDSVSDDQWQKGFDQNDAYNKFSQSLQEAGLTGVYGDKKTLAGQQMDAEISSKAVADAWNRANSLGYIDAQASKVLGIKEGTQTAAAKQQDVQNKQWDKTFDYQATRDKITDGQWLKNFNEEHRKAIVSEAVAKGQLTVQEAELALSKAKTAADIAQGNAQIGISQQNANTNSKQEAWARDPNNPDNKIKNNQTKNTVDYNDALDVGKGMINAKDSITGQPVYSREQILTWVRGLGILPDEKAKLANVLGL